MSSLLLNSELGVMKAAGKDFCVLIKTFALLFCMYMYGHHNISISGKGFGLNDAHIMYFLTHRFCHINCS